MSKNFLDNHIYVVCKGSKARTFIESVARELDNGLERSHNRDASTIIIPSTLVHQVYAALDAVDDRQRGSP